MPYGVWNDAFGATSAPARSVSAGTGAPADSTRRSAASPGCGPPPAVAATLASADGDANIMRRADAHAGGIERRCGQLGRLRHVAVGQCRGDAERRAVQRERRERGDESIVGRDPVGRTQGVALRGRAAGAGTGHPSPGPVAPEVNRIAAMSSGPGSGGSDPTSARSTSSVTSMVVARGAHRIDVDASSAFAGPMTQLGLRRRAPPGRAPGCRARGRRRLPRHRPATRRRPRRSRSTPGGVSMATRSPGAHAAAVQLARRRRSTRSASSPKVTASPVARSTNASPSSCRRRRRSVPRRRPTWRSSRVDGVRRRIGSVPLQATRDEVLEPRVDDADHVGLGHDQWLALAKRCSVVFGNRPARSAAKSSLNTGSLAPHASRTGERTVPSRPATSAIASCRRMPGMQAGCRRRNRRSPRGTAPVRYGARNASPIDPVRRRRDSRVVPSTKIDVPSTDEVEHRAPTRPA